MGTNWTTQVEETHSQNTDIETGRYASLLRGFWSIYRFTPTQ